MSPVEKLRSSDAGNEAVETLMNELTAEELEFMGVVMARGGKLSEEEGRFFDGFTRRPKVREAIDRVWSFAVNRISIEEVPSDE